MLGDHKVQSPGSKGRTGKEKQQHLEKLQGHPVPGVKSSPPGTGRDQQGPCCWQVK